MDESERAQDGYAYNPNSDYYQTYTEAYAEENKQTCEEPGVGDDQVHGFFNLMMPVLEEPGESV